MTNGLICIIGAGASHDCRRGAAATSNLRPPLAKDLFNHGFQHIQSKVRFAQPAVARFQGGGESSIEDFLACLESEGPFEKKQSIFVRYYLQRLLHAVSFEYLPERGQVVSKYHELVDYIRRLKGYDWKLVINLNYDLLLDFAIQHCFGVDLNTESSILSLAFDHNFHYLKLHGSINWSVDYDGRLSESPEDVVLRLLANPDKIRIIAPNHSTMTSLPPFSLEGPFQLPAIVPPVANKTHHMCPSQLLKFAREKIASARSAKLLTVGFSAVDDDVRELLAPLLHRLKTVVILDPGCELVHRRLSVWNRHARQEPKPVGFSKVDFASLTGMI